MRTGISLDWLIKVVLRRTGIVELPGEFSLRGGIIDIFPCSFLQEHQSGNTVSSGAGEMPYRIEFFGDEIDSIRMFNAETNCQRDKYKNAKY
jgi:transcription-repair coupling factor (superfamily II helicase)